MVLVVVGVLMMRAHRRTWAQQQDDPGLNQSELTRLRKRYRRRMQMSGMIAVLGVMLGVGDAVIWEQNLQLIAIFWIVVIGLGVWLLVLGMGDLVSVRVDSKQAMTELREIGARRKEVEAELAEIRRRGSNGEAKSNGRR
jgi:hypothetical protein